MHTVAVTRTLEAPIDTVWSEIADLNAVADWHPSVKTVDQLSESSSGLNAARRCNFHDGTSVVERVVALEPGRRIKLVLSEFSMPMNRFEAEIRLAEAGTGTRIHFELAYEMKYGVLGSVMNALMVKGKMDQLIRTVLAGLDHHIRTGEPVGEDFTVAA